MVPDEFMQDPEFRALAIEHLKLQNQKTALEVANGTRNEEILLARGETDGHFQFVGIILEPIVHDFIIKLENWTKRHPGEDIEILLNSPGGSVLDGLALIDYLTLLKKRGHKITMIGTGVVASMAGVMLQVADERVLTKHAYFGMHEVSSYIGSTSTALAEDHLKFTKQLQGRLVDILTERSTLTKARLTAMWKRKDIWADAEKALKLGMIDRVLD